MKINSGEYKYRNIEIPRGIRPTTEKVREAVFSMIGNQVNGAVVLDLFAGSGVMGLEALSRGAECCYFNEKDRSNFNVIRRNIENCRAEDRAVLSNMDFRRFLSDVNAVFDIVIMDPPYQSGYYDEAFQLLDENRLVSEGGLIIAEHVYDNKLSDTLHFFEKIKEKKYGTIGIDVYRYAKRLAK